MQRFSVDTSVKCVILRARMEDTLDEASAKTGCGNLVLGALNGRSLSRSDNCELLRGTPADLPSLFPTVSQRGAR
jgi:hypothetical protein